MLCFWRFFDTDKNKQAIGDVRGAARVRLHFRHHVSLLQWPSGKRNEYNTSVGDVEDAMWVVGGRINRRGVTNPDVHPKLDPASCTYLSLFPWPPFPHRTLLLTLWARNCLSRLKEHKYPCELLRPQSSVNILSVQSIVLNFCPPALSEIYPRRMQLYASCLVLRS